MKVFLTFLALVIVNINAMIFHDDLRACRGLQNLLDTAAENCAQGAAMYFDREEYAEGYLSFDEDEILDYMEHVRQSCLEKAGSQRILQLQMQAYLYNDSGNCIVLEDGAAVKEYSFSFPLTLKADPQAGRTEEVILTEPSVEVQVYAQIEDPFRQPFVRMEQLAADCIYSNHPQSGV